MERRLAAVLAADVVGYSRLMAEDEAGTHAALKAHLQEVIDPKIAAYHGRVVKLTGDGALAEFASVVKAVECAADIQRTMTARNAAVPENRRIDFRIGINVGDILIEADDIYGDGVNLAVRLEGLAEPGGICVSRNVVNQVKGKVDLGFEDLGEREVKNIPNPVQVFKVLPQTSDSGQVAGAVHGTKRAWRWPAVTGALVVLVVAAGVALWLRPWDAREEPASIETMAYPLPDKPSIAVLPFANMSGDTEQDYFADGMAEDLITDLSKISGLFVISRNSAFTYKGRAVELRQVAAELGVRYLLAGSVRRVGDEVRINAQLIDATTGGHLWAERYDGTLADVFDLQDRVTQRIVEAMALELTPQEAQRLGDPGTDNAAAHDAYLLGLTFYYRRTPESFAQAKEQFERAIALDPDYAAAHTALAKVYAQAAKEAITYSRALGTLWRDTAAMARSALTKVRGQPTADAHVVRSWLALTRHQHAQAIAEAEQALQLQPNDVDALEALAKAQIYAGQPRAGLERVKEAMRQNPAILERSLVLMGLAEFSLGNDDRAAELIERAFALGSEETDYAGILVAAFGQLGRIDEAAAAFEVFRRGYPGNPPDLAQSMVVFPFSDPDVLQRLAEGLERAGVRVGKGGYLPLHAANRLSGSEIESLLSGKTIEGKEFWNSGDWGRRQTPDAAVDYSGAKIQPGVPWQASGSSRVEDDMLCERWPQATGSLELCSVIYRIPDGGARERWGDYVMVTDTGPHPFRLVE